MSNNEPYVQPPEPTFGPPEVLPPYEPAPTAPLPVPPLTHPPGRPHPNFWWAILWCVGLLLATQVPGGVAAAVVLLVGMMLSPGGLERGAAIVDDPAMHVAIGVGILVAHGLIILFSLLCLRLIAGRDWYRQVAVRLPSWTHAGLVLAVVPAFIVLGGGAYQLLKQAGVPTMNDLFKHLFPTGGGGTGTGPSFDMEEMEKLFGRWPLLLAVFCIGVMPGLSEELWCRAFLGRGLVGRHGYVLGILGTSFLFGLIHVDPCQGAMAILMGVMLHYVYQMTRSLLAPMLLHFCNNSLAVTLPRIDALHAFATDQEAAPWHLYATSAFLLFAVCFALYSSRARLFTPPGEAAWEPPWRGVACPPAGAATRVTTPPLDLASITLVVLGAAAVAGSIWLMVAR